MNCKCVPIGGVACAVALQRAILPENAMNTKSGGSRQGYRLLYYGLLLRSREYQRSTQRMIIDW